MRQELAKTLIVHHHRRHVTHAAGPSRRVARVGLWFWQLAGLYRIWASNGWPSQAVEWVCLGYWDGRAKALPAIGSARSARVSSKSSVPPYQPSYAGRRCIALLVSAFFVLLNKDAGYLSMYVCVCVCVCVCVIFDFEEGLESWSSSIVGCVVKTRPRLLQPVPADLRPAGSHTEHKTCLAELSEIVFSFFVLVFEFYLNFVNGVDADEEDEAGRPSPGELECSVVGRRLR